MRHLLGEKITQPWSGTPAGVYRSQPEPAKTGPTGFPGPLTFYPVSMDSLYPATCPLCKWLRGHNLNVLTLLFILTQIFTLILTCVCNIIITISPFIFSKISKHIAWRTPSFITINDFFFTRPCFYRLPLSLWASEIWNCTETLYFLIMIRMIFLNFVPITTDPGTWRCCSYCSVCMTGCRLN